MKFIREETTDAAVTGRLYLAALASLAVLGAGTLVYPEAKGQRCVVHFYRNILSVVPRVKMKKVAIMLRAIRAQENRDGLIGTLSGYDFTDSHGRRTKTNILLEQIMCEIGRRLGVVRDLLDGHSRFILCGARLTYMLESNGEPSAIFVRSCFITTLNRKWLKSDKS